MAYLKLTQVTATKDSDVVTVQGDELLDAIIAGDLLIVKGELPVAIVSTDKAARAIKLQSPWDEDTIIAKAAIVPTSADFRGATQSVKALSANANATFSQLDTMVNTVGTVTLTLPDQSTVDISTVPKIIQDATAAGDTLYKNAQNALTLMGNAPALASQVADDRVAVAQMKSDTAQLKTDAATIKGQTQTIHDDTAQLKSDTATIKGQAQGIHDDTARLKTDATTIKDQTQTIHDATAQLKTDAETIKGQTQTIHDATAQLKTDTEQIKGQVEQLAGGDAPNSLKFGGKTPEQWRNEMNDPVRAIVARTNPIAATLI